MGPTPETTTKQPVRSPVTETPVPTQEQIQKSRLAEEFPNINFNIVPRQTISFKRKPTGASRKIEQSKKNVELSDNTIPDSRVTGEQKTFFSRDFRLERLPGRNNDNSITNQPKDTKVDDSDDEEISKPRRDPVKELVEARRK